MSLSVRYTWYGNKYRERWFSHWIFVTFNPTLRLLLFSPVHKLPSDATSIPWGRAAPDVPASLDNLSEDFHLFRLVFAELRGAVQSAPVKKVSIGMEGLSMMKCKLGEFKLNLYARLARNFFSGELKVYWFFRKCFNILFRLPTFREFGFR